LEDKEIDPKDKNMVELNDIYLQLNVSLENLYDIDDETIDYILEEEVEPLLRKASFVEKMING
jgi:hypothetical protein